MNVRELRIGNYVRVGDVCGETYFCKECWSKLTDTDKNVC